MHSPQARHAAPLIELRDVTKVYRTGGQEVRALDGVSLTIRRGEFVAIMGQSGSGKSTLMNILGCLDRPTGGRYSIRGQDIAALDVMDKGSRWARMVHHIFAAISGLPPSEISTADLAAYRDTEANWPLERGYGGLIAARYAALPAELSTPVSEIDTSGANILLETPRGTVRARSLIVTVSTNVLASGAIRFTPELPARLMSALEGVPTGHANKVAFHFRRDVFGLPDTSYVNFMDERNPARPACSFQVRPFSANLAIAYLGGDLAENLDRAGEAEMTAFAREALGDMFGADIFKELEGTAATSWTTDPHMLGAYSCARPGHAKSRAVLAEPVSERFFLAGEAVSADWFSTVQGAHVTGIEAAEKAAAYLAGAVAAARQR